MKNKTSSNPRSKRVAQVLISALIVAIVTALCVARIVFGLNGLYQGFLCVSLGIGVLAFVSVRSNLHVTATDHKNFDIGAAYQTELTTIYQLAQEYTPDDAARLRAAKFNYGDAKTFMDNLTDARVNVLKWEIAVKQSAHLSVIERATHGAESAKKLIEEIRRQPREMLKYGDFLYKYLPNLAILSTEFLDLTQNQEESRKATLNLIKQYSEKVTEIYESAQLADVVEAAGETGVSLSLKQSKQASEETMPSDFERWQRTVREKNPKKRLVTTQPVVLPLLALVLCGVAVILASSRVMVLFGLIGLAVAIFALLLHRHEKKPFAWLAALLCVILSATSVVGYAQQLHRDAMVAGAKEASLSLLDYSYAVDLPRIRDWTLDAFMKLNLQDENNNGAYYTSLLRAYGIPPEVYEGGNDGNDSDAKQFVYPQAMNPLKVSQGSVTLDFNGGWLAKKSERGMGTRLPFKWTSADISGFTTLDETEQWKQTTTFDQVRSEYGDPSEITAVRDTDGIEKYTMIYAPYKYLTDTDLDEAPGLGSYSGPKVTLEFLEVSQGDFRLAARQSTGLE